MNWTRSHAAYFQVWSFARIILLAGLIEVLYNVGTTVLSGQELPTLFSWNILCNSLAPTPALLVRCQVKNYLNWFPTLQCLCSCVYSTLMGKENCDSLVALVIGKENRCAKKANSNRSKMLPFTMSLVFTKQEGISNSTAKSFFKRYVDLNKKHVVLIFLISKHWHILRPENLAFKDA